MAFQRTVKSRWWPPAATGISIASNTGVWANSGYGQLIASAAANSVLTALVLGVATNVANDSEMEVDIAVGGAGSEVVIATKRLVLGAVTHPGYNGECLIPWHLPITGKILTGNRVSARFRTAQSDALVTLGVALGYAESYDSDQVTTQSSSVLPAAADGVALSPAGTIWNNSSWGEITPGLAAGSQIAALIHSQGINGVQFEMDLGIGAAGAETVISTLAGVVGATANAEICSGCVLPRPYQLAADARVAVRYRMSSAAGNAWAFAIEYYGSEVVPEDPVVETLAASGLQSTQARLRGRIDPNGFTMTGWFEWGLASASPSLTNTTSPTHSVGSGSVFITFGDLLEDLEPNTEYVYRAVGNDGTDDFFGDIRSFTTLGEQVFIDGDVSHPLTWMELTDRDEDLHVYAEVDLNDPPSYYGGYKAPFVLSWKPITRGFSDRTGQVEHMAFGAVLSDVPREFRGFLADPTKRYLTNRPLVERMVDDEERRALGLPRLVANGYVSDYEPQSPLRFSLTGCDWLKKKFSRKATAQRAWQPTVTLDDFPNANAEIVADNGSTLKVNAVGKACPLVYGKVSDVNLTEVEVISPGTGSRLVLDPTLPNAGEFGGNAFGISGASTFAVGQNIRYGYTIVDIDTNEEGPFTRIAGTMVMEFPADHHTAFCFNPISVPGSPSRNIKYRVYMFDGWFNPNTGDSIGNTFIRWKEHDDSTVDGFFIYAASGFGVEFFGPTDGNDWASEGSPSSEFVSIDRGKGALTPIYVGDTVISGVLYRIGLVSRGACADLIAGYVNGVAVDLTTSTEWLTFKNAAAWAGAGFTDPFVEINSRRYTLVYLSGVAGNLLAGVTAPVPNEVGIAMNVWGIEDIGDGSGDVITSLAQQYKHFMRNFLAPDTAPGTDWLATCPTFPHIPELTLVDETSFDVVEDETLVRLPAVGSPGTEGYEGAFIIGPNGELESALDVVAEFNVNLDANGTFTRRGQYQITMEPSEAPEDPAVVNDIVSIVEDSFSIHDDVSGEFFNILPYVHTRDYTGRTDSGWFSTDLGDVDVRDTDSITFYDQEREAPQFQLTMLRATTPQGAATIADVMQHKLARYRHPFRTASFSVPLSGTQIEIGDIFRAGHIEGIGPAGWEGRLVRTMRHELDPNMNRVRLGVYDVEPLLVSGSP